MNLIESILAAIMPPKTIESEGRSFVVVPPGWQSVPPRERHTARTLIVASLGSLVDYVAAEVDDIGKTNGQVFVLIESPTQVSVRETLQTEADGGYTRNEYLSARATPNEYPFGQWIDVERAIISLQANFVSTPELTSVVNLLSSVKEEAVRETIDNGVAQQEVVTRGGVTMATRAIVPNPVTLKPYRTFYEVDQPTSEFVLRLKSQEGQKPLVALFEAQGGLWRAVAMAAIKDYLTTAVGQDGHVSVI